MNGMQKAFAVLCGMTILRTSLGMLLPQGAVKRFAEYGFSLVQTLILLRWFQQIIDALMGAWT